MLDSNMPGVYSQIISNSNPDNSIRKEVNSYLEQYGAGKVSSVNGITPDSNGNITLPIAAGIVYNVMTPPYNARGDGTTDDTAAIQSCLNTCSTNGDGYVYFPGKTFIITATTGLQIPSNIHIILNPKTIIKANNTGVNTYQMLNLYNVSNVYIEGNGATIMGDKDTNVAADGEYGHGVSIRGCTTVYISNLKVTKAYGDGFYVGSTSTTTPPSENVYLINCISDTNNRNGLSIINIKNMLVLGGEYKNNKGADPQFGIDVEPNSNTQMIQNLKIDGVMTSGNVQGGISLVPDKLGGGTNVFDVSVENYTSISDGAAGSTYAGNGIFLGNGVAPSGKIYGKIKFNKCTIINPYTIGVYFMTWQNSPRSVFTDVIVYNNDQRGLTDAENESAFAMDYFSNDPQGIDYGNITFERCGGIDNRPTKLLSNAFYFLSDVNHLFKNILIIDPIFEGNSSTWLKWQAFGSISTKFNAPNTVTLNTSTTLTGFAGQDIVASAAGTYALPSANNCIGLEISLRCTLVSGTATLSAAAGDSIINKGASVTTIGLTLSGTFVKVRSIGNNQWIVLEQNIS